MFVYVRNLKIFDWAQTFKFTPWEATFVLGKPYALVTLCKKKNKRCDLKSYFFFIIMH